jgi:hypothetical protein
LPPQWRDPRISLLPLPLSVLVRTHPNYRHPGRSAKYNRHPDRKLDEAVIPTGGGVLCRRSGGTPAFRFCPCRCLFSSAPTPNYRHPGRSAKYNRHPDRKLDEAVIPTGGGVLCRRSGGTPAFRFCPCRCLFSSAGCPRCLALGHLGVPDGRVPHPSRLCLIRWVGCKPPTRRPCLFFRREQGDSSPE